jgi:hypothetical protein
LTGTRGGSPTSTLVSGPGNAGTARGASWHRKSLGSRHPFFDPAGFTAPAGFPKCDAADSSTHTVNANCKYTSAKVIVAKVFYNKAAVGGFDARAAQDHGTHVAGTVAGVTGKIATVEGVAIDDMSGVAPGAWLGDYKGLPAQRAERPERGHPRRG